MDKKSHGQSTRRYIMQKKGPIIIFFPDEVGLRSPVIQRPFQKKIATSCRSMRLIRSTCLVPLLPSRPISVIPPSFLGGDKFLGNFVCVSYVAKKKAKQNTLRWSS